MTGVVRVREAVAALTFGSLPAPGFKRLTCVAHCLPDRCPRLTDVVEASLHAIPRVKDKGAFARPEARILDSLRASLFDHIAAPVDEIAVTAPAATLFDMDGELGFKVPGELGYEPHEDADDGTE